MLTTQDYKRKTALLLPLLIYAALYLIVFSILENIECDNYFTPYFAIDKSIPFIPIFIIPYVMWFIWVPFVCVLLLLHDEENFIRTRRMLIIGMTAFLIISFVFPTKLNLRPDVLPEDDLFCAIINKIYSADTSTNVFPSIHVYNTCVVWHAVLTSSEKLFTKKWFRTFTSVQAVLIILSTMFVKQHSILDVIGAFAMFGITMFVIRRFIENSPLDRIGRVEQ